MALDAMLVSKEICELIMKASKSIMTCDLVEGVQPLHAPKTKKEKKTKQKKEKEKENTSMVVSVIRGAGGTQARPVGLRNNPRKVIYLGELLWRFFVPSTQARGTPGEHLFQVCILKDEIVGLI